MEGSGSGTGRKKLKHRLAAILSVFSRRSGSSRKRRDEEAPPPPLALPSYARLAGGGKKAASGGVGHHDRRLSVSERRTVPLIRITIDCAGRRSVDAADPALLAPLDADNYARKKLGLPYETSDWDGRKCPPSSPFPVAPHLPPMPPRWKERPSSRGRPSTHSSRRLLSSSSSDDEYDEESSSRRNIFSSRSFSSDSSDFYNCPLNCKSNTTKPRASVSGPCRAPPAAAGAGARRGASQSCRYSFELPRGSTASAATDGGFAVVKRSADPYEDFRKSMEEMIAEWPAGGHGHGHGEEEEHSAEGLLETYLVLNSPRHYPAILAAFADVRETLCP